MCICIYTYIYIYICHNDVYTLSSCVSSILAETRQQCGCRMLQTVGVVAAAPCSKQISSRVMVPASHEARPKEPEHCKTWKGVEGC